MKALRLFRIAGAITCVCMLNACSSQPPKAAVITFSMNEGAGRDDLLLIPLHLKNQGEELLFILDSGSPITILDDSLIAETAIPIGTNNLVSMYGKEQTFRYKAPSLYFGQTKLKTGKSVITWNFEQISNDLSRFNASHHKLSGILGMDCLRNYCLQLDFRTRIVCLYEPDQIPNAVMGKAIELGLNPHGIPTVNGHLFGGKHSLAIDTGCIDKTISGVLRLDSLTNYVITLDFPEHAMYLRSM